MATERPGFGALPPGATDAHMHIFGPLAKYPAVEGCSHLPVVASLEEYTTLARRAGVDRVVIVQPSAYGADNRCTLDALRACPLPCRGVAVIGDQTTDEELVELHGAGVRGVRLNLQSTRYAKDLTSLLTATANRVAAFGWHLQVFASLPNLIAALPAIEACCTPVVVDHMGLAKAVDGPDQPMLNPLLGLVAEGKCWVKLSGAYRVADDEPSFASSVAIARAFVEANSDVLVWGTDWPHIGPRTDPVTTGAPLRETHRDVDWSCLLETLLFSCGDKAVLRKVLVNNPARLYGF